MTPRRSRTCATFGNGESPHTIPLYSPSAHRKTLLTMPDLGVTPVICLGHQSFQFVAGSGKLEQDAILTGKPHESCRRQKAGDTCRRSGERSAAICGIPGPLNTEPDLELVSASLADLGQLQSIDLVLLGNRGGQNLYDIMASMKAIRPDLRIIVTGSGMDDESVLKAIAAGAKGYVDEAASPAEFIQALRIVHQGSVWAPRRVLLTFIERVSASPGRIFPAGRINFTDHEKEVLEMLVAGRSNKEIGSALGIEERTVKAHVAKLMRKVGVQNRIALSVHAITHLLVTAK